MGQPSKGQGAEYQADLQRQAARQARRLARPTQTQKDGAWRKPVHTPNSVTADAGMQSLGARSNPLTNNPISLAVDAAGNFGYIPSSQEMKTITGDYTVDMAAWINQPLKTFTYNGDPTHRVAVGWIAESLDAAGLKEFVQYAADGSIQGVRVETLVAGLHSAYTQSRAINIARISALEAALATATANKLHQRFTYAGVGALTVLASSRTLTITWPKAFADADYTVTANFAPPSGVLVGVDYTISAQTPSGCVITVFTNGIALPGGGVMTVDANHL